MTITTSCVHSQCKSIFLRRPIYFVLILAVYGLWKDTFEWFKNTNTNL